MGSGTSSSSSSKLSVVAVRNSVRDATHRITHPPLQDTRHTCSCGQTGSCCAAVRHAATAATRAPLRLGEARALVERER
jgi:hypothetical protein